MNWEALNAVGQFLGGAGVIASLLYLAVQVRASTRAAAIAAKLEQTRLLNDFTDGLIKSPELNALWLRGRKSIETLSPEEYLRFSNMSLKAFWFFSAGYFQFCQEALRGDDWFELQAVLRFWLRGPGCRKWWTDVGRYMYGDNFVAFIDAEVAVIEAEKTVG